MNEKKKKKRQRQDADDAGRKQKIKHKLGKQHEIYTQHTFRSARDPDGWERRGAFSTEQVEVEYGQTGNIRNQCPPPRGIR